MADGRGLIVIGDLPQMEIRTSQSQPLLCGRTVRRLAYNRSVLYAQHQPMIYLVG